MTQGANDNREKRIAAQLVLTGRVQGVGLRPAVARFAQALALFGFVENTQRGVEILLEGRAQDVDRFERELAAHLPAAAEVFSLHRVHVEPANLDSFRVGTHAGLLAPGGGQDAQQTHGALSTLTPTDMNSCEHCLADVREPGNRRLGYPFTSCTDCGPRYSIIDHMPYERAQTSMHPFPLCEQCRLEYESPHDRRFHAQTNACPQCGPQIWLRDAGDRIVARRTEALEAAAGSLREGRIVAVRGLGGYQLLADAASQQAVLRLRQRKRRCGKPLAVMVRSLAAAEQFARLDDAERHSLSSPSGPIVVASLRDGAPLAAAVSNGLNTVGLMLPTTPLHWLLLDATQCPLVCTSGNVEGEPIVFESNDATARLHGVADFFLEHDRPIQRPIDDSVVRVMAGRMVSLRLGRGYAPLPLNIAAEIPLVALGGHQKSAIALHNGQQAVLGPHVGDLDTLSARERFVSQCEQLRDLYGLGEFQVVCDQHPEYFTTQHAHGAAHQVIEVQHHHAHIAAGMLEHRWLDRQVLGVSFDGTGFGSDGAIWGGEFLLATAGGFQRVGHLRPFPLPGGERAVREPWRMAASLVYDAMGASEVSRLRFCRSVADSLLPLLERRQFSPLTTSAGRLFDGVAALILGIERCDFEGQAAMLLEAACKGNAAGSFGDFEFSRYEALIAPSQPRQLDWRPLVRQVMADRVAGVSPSDMAARFHQGLASAIYAFCQAYSPLPVVLGGGVFQNRVLVELLAEHFAETNQPLGLPGLIPPNDGGLAAGQLVVAASRRAAPL